MIIIISLIYFILSLFLRLFLIWEKRLSGCDAYYFLLNREYIIKQKKIFPTLPGLFILENDHLTYPPGFAIFLTLIPENIIKKYYWIISPLIDSSFLFLCLLVMGNYYDEKILMLTGFIYVFTLANVKETIAMTSRQLGVFLLSLTILFFFRFLHYNDFISLSIAFIFGYVLLMTHKLSIQSLWFVLPIMSLILWDIRPFIFLIALYTLAFILSFGKYLKVLKGHLDIIHFWYRNNKLLNRHQVYESPIYLNKDYTKPKSRYPDNIFRLFFIYSRRFFMLNPFIILTTIVPLIIQLKIFELYIYYWLLGTYIFAFITVLIPACRSIGEGEKYLKLVALPVILISVLPLIKLEWGIIFLFYIILWILFAIISIYSIHFDFKKSKKIIGKSSSYDEMESVFKFITENKIPNIMCIPHSISDSVAYHCRIPVLWGGHNPPMVQLLEDFFPVLKKDLSYFQDTYQVKYILIDKTYCDPKCLFLSDINVEFDSNKYIIYKI